MNKTISKGFFIAGIMNFSVLIFSRLFTNAVIPTHDQSVMSNYGLLMILIWGLAYMSIAKSYQHVKWLILVFSLEKMIYGITWIKWHLNNSVSEVFNQDIMAGIFYSIYGINDWTFCIFFAYVFRRLHINR